MKNLVLGGKWKVEGGRNPPASRLPHSTTGSAGLTLIEMIGVMAVLSILATMLVPNIIEKIQEAERDLEDNRLEEIAGALVKGIKAQGQLPNLTVHPTNSNGWVGMAAPFAVMGTNAIWKVFPGGAPGVTNSTARRVYLSTELTNKLTTTDPNLGMGNRDDGVISTINGPVLMFIVSSSKPDLQLACPTNANISTNEQLWLQNWIKEYDNKGNVSATNRNIVGNVEGSTVRWTNRGQFLHVKIVDMLPYISNVDLQDWHGAIPATLIQPDNSFPKLNSGYPYPFEVKDADGLARFFLGFSKTTAEAGNGWQSTLFIDQSTYSSALPLEVFKNPGAGANGKIDGVNAWRKCTLDLSSFAKYASGGAFNKNVDILAPAGPFYAIGSGSTNRVSRFGNPNAGPGTLPSEAKRGDTQNFFVILGTAIKLFQGQETDFPANTPNLQKTFFATKPNHTLVYSNGIWVEQ